MSLGHEQYAEDHQQHPRRKCWSPELVTCCLCHRHKTRDYAAVLKMDDGKFVVEYMLRVL